MKLRDVTFQELIIIINIYNSLLYIVNYSDIIFYINFFSFRLIKKILSNKLNQRLRITMLSK